MFIRIILDKADGAATLILNRPDVLNALDIETMLEIENAVKDVKKDDTLKVLVITGKGRAFSAGADLKAIEPLLDDSQKIEVFLRTWHHVMTYIENATKPIIAAVNGLALAGGLELVLVCDLAIAAEEARLGDQHANFGLIAGGGGSQRLPRLIGIRKAKELLLTGNWISGKEAAQIGLVNRAVPSDKLEEAVGEMVSSLTSKSPVASRTIKDLVNRGMQADLYTGLDLEVWATIRHDQTEDARERIAAFKEKRKPNFKGR